MQITSSAAAAAGERCVRVVQPLVTVLNGLLAHPVVGASLGKGLRWLRSVHAGIGAIEAPGYQPYFEQLGYSEPMARFHAGFVRHLARCIYVENRNKRVAVSILHDLAKRRRWHPAFDRQIARLGDAYPNGGVIDHAFHKACRPDLAAEFHMLLGRTHNGDQAINERLLLISATIAPHLPSARGRPLSVEGAQHQALLRWSAALGGRDTYTYGLVPESVRRQGFWDRLGRERRTALAHLG